MSKLAVAFILLFFISTAESNSNPYHWGKLKKDTDIVVQGLVLSAKLQIDPDDIFIVGVDPTIELKVQVEDVLYNRVPFKKSSKPLTLYLTGYHNRIPVGQNGAFFLECKLICKVVNDLNGSWLVTQKRTGEPENKLYNSIDVYDSESLFMLNIPKELWSNHQEWQYFQDIKEERLVQKKFITVNDLAGKLATLLK
jgi:hypothetical protein